MVGVTAGELYNRFYNIRLPEFLAFFGGKRFVPIVTGCAALFIAVLLSLVWPPISNVIDSFSNWMLQSDIGGKFGFGVLNRLLVPIGLHHIINTIVYTVIGECNGATGELLWLRRRRPYSRTNGFWFLSNYDVCFTCCVSGYCRYA